MQYAVFIYVYSAKAVIQDLFLFYSKQKTVSGANRTSRERNEHLIMGERKINKNKNHAKMDFLHFFCKKFVYVKKKQYLCTRNQ